MAGGGTRGTSGNEIRLKTYSKKSYGCERGQGKGVNAQLGGDVLPSVLGPISAKDCGGTSY